MIYQFWIGVSLMACMACTQSYQPKPKGYNRFVFPKPSYQHTPDTLPYYFEFSRHATLLPDTSHMHDRYWVEIVYPQWSASVHLTYKSLDGSRALLKSYLDDAYVLTAKHQIKAHAINETIVNAVSGEAVLVAEIEGEVPSQLQFYTTDSVHHFLRGALYINQPVQNDSLRPVIDYLKKDVMYLVRTLGWRKD